MSGPESEAPRSPEVEGLSPRQQDDLSSFYETVLNLSNAMGRVEERSKAQGEELKKVAEKLEKVSEYVNGAKWAFWAAAGVITVVGGILAWSVNSALTVLRIFLSSQ